MQNNLFNMSHMKLILFDNSFSWAQKIMCLKWSNSSRKVLQKIHLLRRPNLTRGGGSQRLGQCPNFSRFLFDGAPNLVVTL